MSVISTTLLPDLRTVNLTTTPQPADTPLTLTVTGVRDGAAGNPIAPGSAIAVIGRITTRANTSATMWDAPLVYIRRTAHTVATSPSFFKIDKTDLWYRLIRWYSTASSRGLRTIWIG